MHPGQKVSNWSLRQQNYLNYPTFTEYFVITSFSYYYFKYFRHAAILPKNCRSSCGGPFLWGPLFGRTCWTCLNPPLNTSVIPLEPLCEISVLQMRIEPSLSTKQEVAQLMHPAWQNLIVFKYKSRHHHLDYILTVYSTIRNKYNLLLSKYKKSSYKIFKKSTNKNGRKFYMIATIYHANTVKQ